MLHAPGGPGPRPALGLVAALLCLWPQAARSSEEGPTDLLERAVGARRSLARVLVRDTRRPLEGLWRDAVVVDAGGQLLLAGDPPAPRSTVTVSLHDGRELPGRILGSDLRTQLSLIKVEADGLVPLRLRPPEAAPPDAESLPDPLCPPPLGLSVLLVTADGAAARGHLRGCERHLGLRDPQTLHVELSVGLLEAALAALPSDVGAPWLDENGHLLALQVEAASSQDAELEAQALARGLKLRAEPTRAYGVPAAVIRVVWPLLERHGHVPRAGLGVESRPVDEALRAHVCGSCGGHVLEALDELGPARAAGVEAMDVLVSVNGVAIPPGRTLHDLLLPLRPRTRALLGLVRAGRRLEIPVILGEL